MVDIFGINRLKRISPFQGLARFGVISFIGFHPMLLIAPLRGFDSRFIINIGLHPMLVIAPLRGFDLLRTNSIGLHPMLMISPLRGF